MSDQNPFDLLEARRNALRLGAGAALGTLLMGRAALGEILKTPLETQGPFWEDEMLLRSDVRGDRRRLMLPRCRRGSGVVRRQRSRDPGSRAAWSRVLRGGCIHQRRIRQR